MENPPYVPYQAYKSKRHNRGHSNPQFASNVAPPPVQPRPVSTLTTGHTYSEPVVAHTVHAPSDAEKRSILMLNTHTPLQRPVSMVDTLIHLPHQEVSKTRVEILPSEKPPEKPLPSPVAERLFPATRTPMPPVKQPTPPPRTHSPNSTPPPSDVPLPASPMSPGGSPTVNGKTILQASSPIAGPSTLSPLPVPSASRRSTFRHIRPAISSPLRSPSMRPQSSSMLASPQPVERRLSSGISTPITPAQDRDLPPIPVSAFELQSQTSPMLTPRNAPSPTPVAPIPVSSVLPPRAVTSGTAPLLTESVPTTSSSSPSPALTPSTSISSAAPSTSRIPARSSAPYRPGFQPKGVYRPRTDEFIEARNQNRDLGRVERTRLERRLEKLVNLHFPPPGQRKVEYPEPRPLHQNRRASSFWDLDLSELKNKSAGDLWRGVVQSQASQGGKNDIRAAEQHITPWEDDASVSQCPLCTASFHPLTNRKHHCRLCGRIICSLPVKFPQRPESCSLLFVVDQSTGRIEEVGEGVDYGVRRRTPAPGKSQKKGEVLNDDEKFLKGVRICRDCRPVLRRQQYRHEMVSVPLFSKLYDAFIVLEKEIEDELPVFQELVINLSKQERPTPEATAVRKRLLEAFAQYDAIAKRMRKLPCPPGSSQDRIQGAIVTRANNFLQKHMFPLQSLPKPKKASAASPASAAPRQEQVIDPNSEVAHVLQPLLEQEALLETFVEEAKAHRKFEDAKTLKNNLQEIRAEIERILANAEEQGFGRTLTDI